MGVCLWICVYVVYMCVYVCAGVWHVRQIKESLGRERDMCGRLVGGGVTCAADCGGLCVPVRSPREGRGGHRVFSGRFSGAVWKQSFPFFWRWICQLSNEILMFLVLGRFVNRSVAIWWCYFLLFFKAFTFEKQWGECDTKTMVLSTSPILHLCILMKTWCRTMILGGGFWGPVGSTLTVILVVFKSFCFSVLWRVWRKSWIWCIYRKLTQWIERRVTYSKT